MEIQTEIMRCIKSIISSNLPDLPEIKVGQTPIDGGIAVQWGAGYNTITYLDGNYRQTLPFLFLAKNKNQEKCADWLNAICNTLQLQRDYPAPKGKWEWVSIGVATTAAPVMYEPNGGWVYSAVVNAQYETDY